MPFKRILCGVDFSELSVRAFLAAKDLARQSGGALHVLHVIEANPTVAELLPPGGLSEMTLTTVEKARASMRTLIESSPPQRGEEIRLSTEINEGNPSEEILRQARDWKADLIAIGGKGAATLDDVIFGAPSDTVVRKAPCSVLVVR